MDIVDLKCLFLWRDVAVVQSIQKEVFDMKTWNRWQELTPKVLGVLLIVVPFVFGMATIGSSSWDAWVLGTVVGVVAMILALLWFGFPRNRVTEGLTVMMGTVLFITPWVLDESSLSVGVWASCIIGVLLIVAAGGMSVVNASRQAAFSTSRAWYRGSMESETSNGYR
jgi:membrane-bound ClpP family serine protease